jgi:hypothetical protein
MGRSRTVSRMRVVMWAIGVAVMMLGRVEAVGEDAGQTQNLPGIRYGVKRGEPFLAMIGLEEYGIRKINITNGSFNKRQQCTEATCGCKIVSSNELELNSLKIFAEPSNAKIISHIWSHNSVTLLTENGKVYTVPGPFSQQSIAIGNQGDLSAFTTLKDCSSKTLLLSPTICIPQASLSKWLPNNELIEDFALSQPQPPISLQENSSSSGKYWQPLKIFELISGLNKPSQQQSKEVVALKSSKSFFVAYANSLLEASTSKSTSTISWAIIDTDQEIYSFALNRQMLVTISRSTNNDFYLTKYSINEFKGTIRIAKYTPWHVSLHQPATIEVIDSSRVLIFYLGRALLVKLPQVDYELPVFQELAKSAQAEVKPGELYVNYLRGALKLLYCPPIPQVLKMTVSLENCPGKPETPCEFARDIELINPEDNSFGMHKGISSDAPLSVVILVIAGLIIIIVLLYLLFRNRTKISQLQIEAMEGELARIELDSIKNLNRLTSKKREQEQGGHFPQQPDLDKLLNLPNVMSYGKDAFDDNEEEPDFEPYAEF